MQSAMGKTDGANHGKEACPGSGKEKCTSPKPRRLQSRKKHLENRQICIWCLRKIPEEGTHSGCSGQLEDAYNRVQFKLLMELFVQYGISLTLTRWLCSSTLEKKDHHATWKLDLHAPTTDNGTSTRLAPASSSLQCLHKGTGGSNSNGLGWVLTLADEGLMCKTACDTHTLTGAAGKSVTMVPRDRVWNQSKQEASPVVHPTTKQLHKQCQQSPSMEKSQNAQTVSDTLGSTLMECWHTRPRSNQQNSGARKDCLHWKPWP